MNKDFYPFRKLPEENLYTFVSEGFNGSIRKTVSIARIEAVDLKVTDREIYNLAFGNLTIVDGEWTMDDSTRSNNGDMPKVIATVAQIALEFMNKNQTATLAFSGFMDKKSLDLGRNQRNNLYQRAINSNFKELCKSFKIIGIKKDHREDYVPGSIYDSILIKRKK